MRNILRLDHWILFILALASFLNFSGYVDEIIKVIASSVLILWTFSVGYYGEQKRRLMGLPPKKLAFFQFNSFFTLIFGHVIFMDQQVRASDSAAYIQFVLLIGGIAVLYFLFAAIHMVVFAARTFAEVEEERPVAFSGYFSRILMMIFFAIGVWMLQPRVKRYLIEEYDEVNPFESI